MNIVIIGAQKAGTTWLFSMLKQHPRVGSAFMKEVHYFDQVAKPGFNAQSRIANLIKRKKIGQKSEGPAQRAYLDYVLDPDAAFSDDWYTRIFQDKPENRLKIKRYGSIVYCDATPSYSAMAEKGIAHMAKLLPRITPILLVRDPVKRMISGLSMSLSRSSRPTGQRPEKSIRLLRNRQEGRGNYSYMISMYRKHFPDLTIIPFGQIQRDPQSVMRQVEQKYGLDPIRYRGLKTKRNSHTGKLELAPRVLEEIDRLCAPQYEYLKKEFGSEFLEQI